MTVFGIFAPDCDCDAMDRIAHRPIAVRRYPTDEEACKRYLKNGPERCGTEAIHGPSGHLLAVL